MYLIKNAYLNIMRKKGRNILIGLIVVFITAAASIALVIHKSGSALIEAYKNSNPLAVSFSLNPMDFRNASEEEKTGFEALTIDDIKKYGDSSYVKDYYYMEEASLAADDITPVSYEEENKEEETSYTGAVGREKPEMGSFRITGYSDPSYIEEFVAGTKKIKEGSMYTKDSTDKGIVISEELAEENNISVDSEITFYLSSNKEQTFTGKVIGIYEDNSSVESGSFMQLDAMNSRNQIYTNITFMNEILSTQNEDTTNSKMMSRDGLTAKFYLYNNKDLESFTKEVQKKGLSEYYAVSTNEDELTAALKPIENISQFSVVFLVIILIVGAVILGVINLINIRERKYEIGVLRAIGMRKGKVALQFILEIFMVSVISLIIGATAGSIASQSVTNGLLKNEITSYQNEEESLEQNFGGSQFEKPSMGMNKTNKIGGQNVDYIDTLSVKMDVFTLLQLFVVSLFLTVSTSLISILFINHYEPNKILQNR